MYEPPVFSDTDTPDFPDAQADPIVSAAASLIALGELPQTIDPQVQAAMEKALHYHVVRIDRSDFAGLEIMLTCQTQMLHRLFAQSVARYAAGDSERQLRLHSAVALKSQECCRKTVRDLTRLKKPRIERDLGHYYPTGG